MTVRLTHLIGEIIVMTSLNMDDVTFIIQGNVAFSDAQEHVDKTNIPTFFPTSKIILSTWGDSEEVYKINNITVVVSVNPTAHSSEGERWADNFENQCKTTLAGLRLCETSHVVKVRSDCYFKGNRLSSIFKQFVVSDKEILVNSKLVTFPYAFYSVDYFQLGRVECLLKIWEKCLSINIDLNKYQKFQGHHFDRRKLFFANLHSEQVLYFAQMGGAVIERAHIPSFSDYVFSWRNVEKRNFCIGRVNLQLQSEKHPSRWNDFVPYVCSFKILSYLRLYFSYFAGFFYRFMG